MFGNGEKVLMVDDEEPILKTLVSITQRLGYQAGAAQGPKQVIKMYEEWNPQVVFMDRNMPGAVRFQWH